MKKENKCGVPENEADINKCIYTYLHLEESDIFQLLHNESSKGINEFQVYGKFQGERIKTSDDKTKFLLQRIEFKLVNLGKDKLYRCKDAELTNNVKTGEVDCNIIIEIVKRQKKGVDFTHEQLFLFENGQMIDIHLRPEKNGEPGPLTRNGIPCLVKAHFAE